MTVFIYFGLKLKLSLEFWQLRVPTYLLTIPIISSKISSNEWLTDCLSFGAFMLMILIPKSYIHEQFLILTELLLSVFYFLVGKIIYQILTTQASSFESCVLDLVTTILLSYLLWYLLVLSAINKNQYPQNPHNEWAIVIKSITTTLFSFGQEKPSTNKSSWTQSSCLLEAAILVLNIHHLIQRPISSECLLLFQSWSRGRRLRPSLPAAAVAAEPVKHTSMTP